MLNFLNKKFFLVSTLLFSLLISSTFYIYYQARIPSLTLNQSSCLMDGYAEFLIINPSGEGYEISIKKNGAYLDKQEIDIFYFDANREIHIFAPCTPVGENGKCNFEVRVGKAVFHKEVDCNFEKYKCDENKRSGCIFGNTIVHSNLDSLLWLRSHASGSPKIIAWWDYGKELKNIGNVTPIASNPSLSLMESVVRKNSVKQLESEEKIKDVANFFLSTNETDSVCIAKNYGAKYVYLVEENLGQIYWMEAVTNKKGNLVSSPLKKLSESKMEFYLGQGFKGIVELRNRTWWAYILDYFSNSTILSNLKTLYVENGKIVISEPEHPDPNNIAIISSDFKKVFLLTNGLERTTMIKLLLLDGYETKYFAKVYSNNDVKIYSINLNGCQ